MGKSSDMALKQVEKIAKMPVNSVDDKAALAKIQKNQGILSMYQADDGTEIGAVVAASQTCTVSRIPIAAALSAYVNYAFTPVKCCGGPGLSAPLQAQLLAGHKTLESSIASLNPAQYGKQYAEWAAKAAKDKASKEALKKGLQKIASKAGEKMSGSQVLPIDDVITDLIDVEINAGTIPGMGQPQVSQFSNTKDIRILGLFSGLFSSVGEKENLKLYARTHFESMLRRLALSEQLNSFDGSKPQEELKQISELEQKINNIMFFFDQMMNEVELNKGLAFHDIKSNDYWRPIVNMVSETGPA